MKNENISDLVANSMLQIINSKEHKDIFKIASSDKCCNCTSCEGSCLCKKCEEKCNGCVKEDVKKEALSEMIEMLSKISETQDELGLIKSSNKTLEALETMVRELSKIAEKEDVSNPMRSNLDYGNTDDSNDATWSELIAPIKEDDRARREFKDTAHTYPDVMMRLRDLVNKSHEGAKPEKSTLFEEGIGSEDSDFSEEPDVIVGNPDDDEELLSKPFPREGKTQGFFDLFEADLDSEERNLQTIPPSKKANRYSKLLQKLAQEIDEFELDNNDQDDDNDFMGDGFPYDKDLSGQLRIGEGKEAELRDFETLTPEEQLEQEEGAGLLERLDIDPDELSWEDTRQGAEMDSDFDDSYNEQNDIFEYDDDEDLNEAHFVDKGSQLGEDLEAGDFLELTNDDEGDEYWGDRKLDDLLSGRNEPENEAEQEILEEFRREKGFDDLPDDDPLQGFPDFEDEEDAPWLTEEAPFKQTWKDDDEDLDLEDL